MSIVDIIKKRDLSKRLSEDCKAFANILKSYPYEDNKIKNLITEVEENAERLEHESLESSVELTKVIEDQYPGCKHPEVVMIEVDGAVAYKCVKCLKVMSTIPPGSIIVNNPVTEETT